MDAAISESEWTGIVRSVLRTRKPFQPPNVPTKAMSAVTKHIVEHLLIQMDTQSLTHAQLLHSLLLKTSLSSHTFLSNRLIKTYFRLGSLDSARNLFDEMPHRNAVSYNTLISSLAHHGFYNESLHIFSLMQNDHFSFDDYTFVGAATACAGLGYLRSLRQLHGALILNGMEMNMIMCNALVDGYGKCGDVNSSRVVFDGMEVRDVVSWTSLVGGYARDGWTDKAREVFEQMPVKNAVSWTALISGHEQNGEEERAIELFEQMMDEGVVPTAFTLVSVLSACARLGLIGKGKQVHSCVLRRALFNIFTCNALIDMYSKCGDMRAALAVFELTNVRDIVSWNSMVTGFAHNGLGEQSLAIFERMIESGVRPTHVTFLGVISACNHAGLVSEGRRFLNTMEKEFGICPTPEHYALFVDALGKKRRLLEAAELIESLPASSVGPWGALLGACRVHGDLELGKRAAESLFALEPENGARYVTLSNIYAAAGRWDEARRVRVAMKGKGLRKEVGCSWVEVRSVKHVFGASDESHFQKEEIYGMLDILVNEMKDE